MKKMRVGREGKKGFKCAFLGKYLEAQTILPNQSVGIKRHASLKSWVLIITPQCNGASPIMLVNIGISAHPATGNVFLHDVHGLARRSVG